MALIRRKTRKRLTKDLKRIVKKHGAEMALALVTGIITGLAAEGVEKKKKSRPKPKPAALVRPEPAPVVVRKRAQA
jgi:hypothetical protein